MTAPVSQLELDIARRFVATVVVVDDQAAYDTETPDFEANGGSDLNERADHPVANGQTAETNSEDRGAHPEPTSGLVAPEPPRTEVHDLSAVATSEAFSKAGMVCTILRPPVIDAPEDLSIATFDLASSAMDRADVVVLDWRLARGEPIGETALKLMRKLLDQQIRLRLLCVYTGEPGVGQIAEEIAETLGVALTNGYSLTSGNTTITVLAKEHNTDADETRRVPVSDLPGRVVSEFAEATAGLLSGFAVSALGALRDRSASVMDRFAPDIDPALLGHRVLLPHPNDCGAQVTDALIDELRGVLAADDLVTASLDTDRSLDWSDRLRQPIEELRKLPLKDPVGQEIDRLVREGGASRDRKKKKEKWTTKLFARPDAAYRSDLRFADLLQTRHHYASAPPMLTLGVVLQELPTEETETIRFYVCVQPPCDSVRLKDGQRRQFPLLPLEIASKATARFVVMVDQDPIPFKAAVKLHRVRLVEFEPNEVEAGIVQAKRDDERWLYEDANGGSYRHLGQLRETTSVWLAQALGADTSRIGVDNPEWIRLERNADGIPSASADAADEAGDE